MAHLLAANQAPLKRLKNTSDNVSKNYVMPQYTQKQGQYLAFIDYYTKVNKRAPAEADIQCFFNVTPPTVHQMILSLEKSGFISREPGKARSIKVLLPSDQLPDLE